MKNFFVAIVVIGCVVLLGAGALLAITGDLFHREAKGLILYGTAGQLEADKEIDKEEVKYTYQTDVKIVEKELMIIREKDMKELCSHGLVNRVNKDDQTESVETLEPVEEKPILYAKKAGNKVTVAGVTLKVTAGDDLIIGSGRTYDQGYLVVSDSQYEALPGEETGMLVLRFDKAADKKIDQYQYEQVQLVDIK